jgi:hypothetical protein
MERFNMEHVFRFYPIKYTGMPAVRSVARVVGFLQKALNAI